MINSIKSKVSEAPKETAKPKKVNSESEGIQTDIANMLSAVLTVLAVSSTLKDEIKPNTGEIEAVSFYLSRIIARHIDTSKKINADVLDLIGILAVGGSWYLRAKPFLVLPAPTKKGNDKPKEQIKAVEEAPGVVTAFTPGGNVSDQATASFLENSARLSQKSRDE